MVVEEEYPDEDFLESDAESTMEQDNEINPEEELARPEGTVISADKWKAIFQDAEFAEDLKKQIRQIKPYYKCSETGRILNTQSLESLYQGACRYLCNDQKIKPKVLRSVTTDILARCDILLGLLGKIQANLDKFKSVNSWWNLFNFLRHVPNPNDNICPRIFTVKIHPLRTTNKKKFAAVFQKTWLDILARDVPDKVLIVLIPHITDNVLPSIREPFKTADFFFKHFDKGNYFAILSLGAIFKLIVHHNFEYPQFYDQVYALCQPSVMYMDHKKKFLELLDIFLSSTHIPNYVVAGFVKRLCRLLLVAPLDAQEPVLGLIRNLITRHPMLTQLLHREIASAIERDPYDENEPLLSKCNAMESSLWELKALQKHWHQSVGKRANFVDKGLQKMESFVRFRCMDEYFSVMIAKRFGSEANTTDEQYSRMQDGSDDEVESGTHGKRRKLNAKGKFARMREIEKEHSVPVNFTAPSNRLFNTNSFNFEYSKHWTI